MKWTEQHSKNAVAAKARRRMAPPDFSADLRRCRIRTGRAKAKWRLQIRDLEHGESLTLRLYRLPWPARYIDATHHEHSAASIAKLISRILTSAP